jgi:hypothetical protein
VTQQFITPKAIKICWALCCFRFLYPAISVPVLKFKLYPKDFSLTFGTKLLLSLLLRQSNSAQVVTCKFLQGIGSSNHGPANPYRLHYPSRLIVSWSQKDHAFFALFSATSCKLSILLLLSPFLNFFDIELCSAVIFKNYLLFVEVKNFEEIKPCHWGFLLLFKKKSVLVWRTAKFTLPKLNRTKFLSFSGETKLFGFSFILCESCVIGTDSVMLLGLFSDTNIHFHNHLYNI